MILSGCDDIALLFLSIGYKLSLFYFRLFSVSIVNVLKYVPFIVK